MKQTLFERRSKMLKYVSKGVPLKEIVVDLAKEYCVSTQAIYKDNRLMAEWGPQVLQLQDDSIIYETLAGLKQVIPNTWHEYLTGDNTSARIGALRLLKDTYESILSFLVTIGRVETKPEEFNMNIKGLDERIDAIIKLSRESREYTNQ